MSLDPAACKGCGAKILWGADEDGKAIPLDPSAPVYEEDGSVIRRTRLAYVSHFKTCPQANQFSATKKANPQGSLL